MGIELLEKSKKISQYYSKEVGDKEAKINFEAIAELEEPLEKILEQIGSQNFDLIIGDDASGRIPTLILSKFFKAKAEKEGQKSPQTIFIAGGTRFQNEIKETIKVKKEGITQLLEKTGRKIADTNIYPSVLVVTETISSGQTLQPLLEALKEQGFYFSVAAIAVANLIAAEKFKNNFSTSLVYGRTGVPIIWGQHRLGGTIRKENKLEIHSRPIKKSTSINEKPSSEAKQTQGIINLSRKDANIITDRLIEKFLKN